MSQVSPEERQKAKATAANLSVASNDAAVALGATGAVAAGVLIATGVGAFAGVGVGLVLAVCSFGAWYMGNRYQRLANDPPRDDYAEVTISAGQYSGAGQSSTDVTVTLRVLAANQIILADAMDAVVTSLERYDGAIAAGETDAAQSQADAIQQNAGIATSAQAVIIDCASSLNAAWSNAADLDWSTAGLPDVKSNYLNAAGPPHQVIGQTLQSVLDSVNGLATQPFANLDPDQDPITSLTDMPARPSALFSPALLSGMSDLANTLSVLVSQADAVA